MNELVCFCVWDYSRANYGLWRGIGWAMTLVSIICLFSLPFHWPHRPALIGLRATTSGSMMSHLHLFWCPQIHEGNSECKKYANITAALIKFSFRSIMVNVFSWYSLACLYFHIYVWRKACQVEQTPQESPLTVFMAVMVELVVPMGTGVEKERNLSSWIESVGSMGSQIAPSK